MESIVKGRNRLVTEPNGADPFEPKKMVGPF